MKSILNRIIHLFNKRAEENKLLSALPLQQRKLLRSIQQKKLTYLNIRKLINILHSCNSLERSALSGIFIEAGCALGGSAILIAHSKNKNRSFFVYDVFGMIPPPTSEDTLEVHERYQVIADGKSSGIGGSKYYGYEKNLYKKVQNNLLRFGINTEKYSVKLIKGLLQETMHVTEPVVFAHIDVDWYEPVKVSLERIYPRLVENGVIILDDYFDWGGCRKATDEFLRDKMDEVLLDDTYGSLKITKKKA
jgi:hypothetical protein